MPLQIIRNNLTKVTADVIVNTANPEPRYMAGTDSAIYRAAGEEKLLSERKKIGSIEPGDVAVTPAFNLPAKYIIHTVGPSWEDGNHGEFDILHSCYRKSLVKAAELGAESIAFPLIATGVYGFPKKEALQIAIAEISSFLMKEDTEMTIMLVVFDERAFMLSKNIFCEIKSFITNNIVDEAYSEEYGIDIEEARSRRKEEIELYEDEFLFHKVRAMQAQKKTESSGGSDFDLALYKKEPDDDLSFSKHLIKLLNAKNIDNVTAYKRSNITKGAFSKIMCGDTKIPKRQTVLGLCIGLQLTLRESIELLASAGYAFNISNKADKLIIQCIIRKHYDIYLINIMLFEAGHPQLGNVENKDV